MAKKVNPKKIARIMAKGDKALKPAGKVAYKRNGRNNNSKYYSEE